MKARLITIATTLMMFAAAIYAQPSSEQIASAIEDPVHIPDPNLRAAIRNELRLPAAAVITPNDMDRLKRLSAYRSDIINLSGLEFAKHLEDLVLGHNPISDLRPLAGLTNLRRFIIPDCQISDISPLSGLTQLVELIIRENPISDLTPLARLTKLKYLDLSRCLTVDFSPLARLTNLLTLQIDHNKIVDIRLPLTLTSLRKLELQHNQITDVRPLSTLTSLQHLQLQHNQITDVRSLSTLTSLQHLQLQHNQVTDIRSLSTLTSLQHLQLQHNQITDIRSLSHFTKLTSLNARSNRISDITPLANLTNLVELRISSNRIRDVSPLSGLFRLEFLEIHRNQITDHSPLDALTLSDFVYDQICDMPALPVQPRLDNRRFPSIFARWSAPGWPPVSNRPDLTGIENVALHDLRFSVFVFGLEHSEVEGGFDIRGDVDKAISIRDSMLAVNPNMINLMDIRLRADNLGNYPPDWPYWIRDAQGNIFEVEPGISLIDFTHPGVQDRIVQQAIAVSKCGLYDGIFFDYWHDELPILADFDADGNYQIFRGLEAENQARLSMMQRIRAATRPDFLIMGNTNDRIQPITGPYINGGFMEGGVPSILTGEELEKILTTFENSLTWLENNLREPRINGLEGWTIPTEAPDSPNNLRWMRATTTLSLTHSDGYVVYTISDKTSESVWTHYWYDFWDADLGRPVGKKSQLYQDISGLYIREFTNGWAVYNHSGETQEITLPESVAGVASGIEGTTHTLPNYDGEMYLRVKPVNPADVNGDGVVNILDLVVVAQAISTGEGAGDVNGDGVVNVFDLLFVAGAIGGGAAAPSVYSPDTSIISAADVERWLAGAQGFGIGNANFQRGIRFLEGLLAALTPKETALLPNYPNPFNPETWIPYRLARRTEVAITIYDTKGMPVRRLAIGNQAAGHYAARGKAAHWDGRNEDGEAVASGIYIYQFRAGDYAASRRMVIVK